MIGDGGEMQVFVRVVERNGFSQAAESLGLTPSAVSKIVTRLEARLGVRLLNRTTRRLAPTAEGEAYLEAARRILRDIDAIETTVSAARATPRGLLTVNTGAAFAMHQLLPAVPEFRALYPEVELDIQVTDRIIDLVREGADLAIRTGRLPDSALIARKICDVYRIVCASPAYLARYGTPRVPADLAHHDCLFVSHVPSLRFWPFRHGREVVHVEISSRVRADNADSLLTLALAGGGILRTADYVVGVEIAAGRLVPILTDFQHFEPIPVAAVHPPGRHRAPKVGAMLDFLVERFGDAPWRAGLDLPLPQRPARARSTGGRR
ncbi:MAG: LysR family transcriptional regulator [Alphaproteobacteria bacterium]|nr:LysR family transcriptional regulator [Alphaproteobacteria bacterium]